jgi:hypothetical protein
MHRWEVTRGGQWTGLMEDPGWWAARAPVLRDITLNSLRRQTDQDFDVIISMRTWDYVATNPCVQVGRAAGVRWILAPYMHWQYPLAPNQLPDLCEWYGGAHWLALVHLDSDDCYRADTVEKVRQITPSAGLMAWWAQGFLYSPKTGHLAHFGNNRGPRPFWVEFYNRAALRTPQHMRAYRARWGYECYHSQVGRAPNNLKLPWPGMFCQIIHGANAETAWVNPNIAKNVHKTVTESVEKASILRGFGLEAEHG